MRAPTEKETETVTEASRDQERTPVMPLGGVDLVHGRMALPSNTREMASPPGKILLIDDSALALDTVSNFLGDMGWTVLTAQRGTDAVAMGSTPELDVVIADLNMPDMNGIEVFRRLYAIDPLLPVIILSEEAAMPLILETVHAGVFDFVPKSDYERMLPAAVRRAVAHRRIRRENQELAADLVRTNESLERRVAEQARLLEERLRHQAALEREAELAPLRKEVEIARGIQTSILPAHVLVPGLEIAAQMIPASEVGGDYYDVRPTPDGCWLGIGDVVGHGLGAGLVMLMLQSGLSSLVTHSPDALPHQILPALNRMLVENLRQRMGRDDYATLTLFRYFATGRLAFAGAHEDIIVCGRSGQIRTVPTVGTWVGISDDISRYLENQFLDLEAGDIIVLYTDGIPEARREHEPFGLPRLISEVQKRRAEPVEAILDGVLHAVFEYCGGNPQDDATLLVLRYLGA
jgi:serine phosphatase RsbU (regulator of sigma subunit)